MASNSEGTPGTTSATSEDGAWRILVVEDDEAIAGQIVDFLSGLVVSGKSVEATKTTFEDALARVRQRSVDLVVLDVYSARPGTQSATGLDILEVIRKEGFVCVVLYTAHPESVQDKKSTFVRVVGKEAGGFGALESEITALFALGVPGVYRWIGEHVDRTLGEYMWSFVEPNWNTFEPLVGRPEFLRVLLQRLAWTLSRNGIEDLATRVFPGIPSTLAPDTIHPAEMFIMPALRSGGVRMGDVRLRRAGTREQVLVVLWPSCDMVVSDTRTPKVKRIHCAVTSQFDQHEKVKQFVLNGSNTKRKEVERLIGNTDDERFHMIPGIARIPNLWVDFQEIDVVPLADVDLMECLATLASPFAESLSSRYVRYLGRLGTPDVDKSLILGGLPPAPPASSP